MTRMTLGVETPIFVNCYGLVSNENKEQRVLSAVAVVSFS